MSTIRGGSFKFAEFGCLSFVRFGSVSGKCSGGGIRLIISGGGVKATRSGGTLDGPDIVRSATRMTAESNHAFSQSGFRFVVGEKDMRVNRSGSFGESPTLSRSGERVKDLADNQDDFGGLRLVSSQSPAELLPVGDPLIEGFLIEMVDRPCDVATYYALADYLDDLGREGESKLTYLTARYFPLWEAPWEDPERLHLSKEVNELILAGVRPIRPAFVDPYGIVFVQIPPGVYTMGSPASDPDQDDDEEQSYQVIARPFWMSQGPIMQEQWERITGVNPSHFQNREDSPRRPVEQVSWDDVQKELPKMRQASGLPYRLPSEIEWEYACRAGTPTRYHFGDTLTPMMANYSYGPSERGETSPVGDYPPNAWGLLDMHGNVWEWCQFEYAKRVQSSPKPDEATLQVLRGGSKAARDKGSRSSHRELIQMSSNFRGSAVGTRFAIDGSDTSDAPESEGDIGFGRVIRCGSWDYDACRCRSASRNGYTPAYQGRYLGFRLVL